MSEAMKTIEGYLERSRTAFEEFVSLNDERLGNLQDRLEDLETSKSLPGAGGRGNGETRNQAEYRKEFEAWLRNPRDDSQKHRLAEAQRELVTKDVTIGTSSEGGYALPEQIGSQIERRVQQLNPFRRLVQVQPIGTNDYKQLVDMGNATAGWVGETGSRSATDTPELRERAPTMGEIYAYPQASEWSLDDLFFDVGQWLVDSVAEQFASMEATAIVSGNGTNKPTGFLNSSPVTTEDDASPLRDADTLKYLPISSPASPVAINYDSLVDTVYDMKEAYLMDERSIAWVMHRTTTAAVRKLKDSQNRPIWQDNQVAGQPPTLLGFPVYTTSAMPTYAAAANAIAFGNWRRGYLLVDRVGMRITLDPYTNPGYVRFYVRARRGGRILNNDALRILKIDDA